MAGWWNSDKGIWLVSAGAALVLVAAAVAVPVIGSHSNTAAVTAIAIPVQPMAPPVAPSAAVPLPAVASPAAPVNLSQTIGPGAPQPSETDRAGLASALGALSAARQHSLTAASSDAPAMAAYDRAVREAALISDPVERAVALANAWRLLEPRGDSAPSPAEQRVDRLLVTVPSKTP